MNLNRIVFKDVARRISAKIGGSNNSSMEGVSPHDEQSTNREKERTSSGSLRTILRRAGFAMASVKRLAKKSKAVLGCVFSVETLDSEDMPQAQFAESEAETSPEESLRSAKVGDTDDVEKESVSCKETESKVDAPHEQVMGKGSHIDHLMSEEGSDESLTDRHEEEKYRYYHQLPCNEKQPVIEEGTVRRLAEQLLPLFTGGLSNDGYLKAISTGKPVERNEEPYGNLEDGNDTNDTSATKISLAPGVKMENGDSSHQLDKTPKQGRESNLDGEERKLLEQSCSKHEKESSRPQQGSSCEPEGAKRLERKVSFRLPVLDTPHSPQSDNEGTSNNGTPSPEREKERQENRTAKHVSIQGAGLKPQIADESEELEQDFMSRQVSFADSEDYCTPILEYELRYSGCVLQ